jgi:DNA protecting protein DprA
MTSSAGILRLQLAKGVGAQSLNRLLDAFRRKGGTLDDLPTARSRELVDQAGLRPQLAEAIDDARSEATRLADQLAAQDIQILARGFPPYPSSLAAVLGDTAPPVLFVRGDLEILNHPGVGFAGSRKSSPIGLEITSAVARDLANLGVNVVSGYANGVDLKAHRAALECGGATTLVLAEGLLKFRPKADIAELLDSGRSLILSEFSPTLRWLGRSAMQRNRTICGLSRALVVVESGMDGGTFAAAATAQQLGVPLFVVDFAEQPLSAPGNAYFLQRGALPLHSNGKPSLGNLLQTIGVHDIHGDKLKVASSSSNESGQNRHAPAADKPTTADSLVTNQPQESSPIGGRRNVKRLIEVDLPIARVSAHARREKSIRHGHISTLHIWWARRPLAACRAVICATLWPDPADEHCPQAFRDAAARHLVTFAKRVYPEWITDEKEGLQATASKESLARWELFSKNDPPLDPVDPAHQNVLRFALLDFIADFANWDNSTVPAYLETSRALTQAAHEAIGGEPGTRPLVVDPFAGGGSIPLEALRVGADAFASDLNPVAVLLNKVVLEYIPKYGQKLADEVRKWGQWIKEQAEEELAEFYPKDPDGATPITYLWARTIRCEGAGCGAEVPLLRSLWLAKKANRSVALKFVPKPEAKRVDFQMVNDAKVKDVREGTVKRGSATCPCCGFTTPVKSVREQLKKRRGGVADARLYCVVTTRANEQGRFYRLPNESDLEAVARATAELEKRKRTHTGPLSLVPDENISLNEIRRISAPIYGMITWGNLFSPRQALALTTLCRLVCEAGSDLAKEHKHGLAAAVQTCLGFGLSRLGDRSSSVCRWDPTPAASGIINTFSRQAIPMMWDFAEGMPLEQKSGGWLPSLEWIALVADQERKCETVATTVTSASAAQHPLPNDSVHALVTDPPYYDAVPYAYLSDFFYVWLRRSIGSAHSSLLNVEQVPKEAEIVVDRPHELSKSQKDIAFYEKELTKAFAEGRRILRLDGIAVIVFASKTTASWEAILQAVVDAGWTMTGSWPIDTEMESRVSAQGQARLASSVHLVCRPRPKDESGDWRDVLSELPQRMHEWMLRLASEGVVGADAIFACLGPALEIFSRYSRVEKANGDPVMLKEYLEHVWAAVSKEAISTIFRDADASGLEPDARLTAMWLWTIGGAAPAANGKPTDEGEADVEGPEEEDEGNSETATASGLTLEFDAARKIAQGLGIHLERSESFVEVKGDKARLLPVVERTKHLFGEETEPGPAGHKRAKKKVKQLSLFEELDEAEEAGGGWKELKGPPPATTILDRLHQAMILFGAQRGELLKRFLVEDGVGKDTRFWKLAQSLAALYPPGTDERRWVEGVLARKKGLGL